MIVVAAAAATGIQFFSPQSRADRGIAEPVPGGELSGLQHFAANAVKEISYDQ